MAERHVYVRGRIVTAAGAERVQLLGRGESMPFDGLVWREVEPKSPVRLTTEERAVLNMLADAWNEYMQLPDRASADDIAVTDAIHQAQQAIALRVARRADPDFWRPSGTEVDRG